MIVNAIIQARLGSTRFPGKVLERFGEDQTVLDAVIVAVNQARGLDKIIVAIPNNEKGLESALKRWGDFDFRIKIFLGHPTDLTQRFLDCIAKYPCDAFIRVCADSPVLDPALISDVADRLRSGVEAYSNLGDNVPDGQHVEGLTADFFYQVATGSKGVEREHCVAAMYRSPFKDLAGVHIVDNLPYFNWPKMTVDYPEDLVVLRKAAALADRPIVDIGWREWAQLIRRVDADGDERRQAT